MSLSFYSSSALASLQVGLQQTEDGEGTLAEEQVVQVLCLTDYLDMVISVKKVSSVFSCAECALLGYLLL